jgi:hypothetical protein
MPTTCTSARVRCVWTVSIFLGDIPQGSVAGPSHVRDTCLASSLSACRTVMRAVYRARGVSGAYGYG